MASRYLDYYNRVGPGFGTNIAEGYADLPVGNVLDSDNPDVRIPSDPESDPFEDPAPGVQAAKDKHDPFADDPDDPRLAQLKNLDQQIKDRQGSLGGFFAALSPYGDKTMANLMAQRHMYGQEYHQERSLSSAYARQNQALQAALEKAGIAADAAMANAATRGAATTGAAQIRATQTPHNIGPQGLYNPATDETIIGEANPNAKIPPRAPVVGIAKDEAGNDVMVLADGTKIPVNATLQPPPGKGPQARQPVNPQIKVIQSNMTAAMKRANDPNASPQDKLAALAEYNAQRRLLDRLSGGAPGTAPAAAAGAAGPSEAPGINSGDYGPAPPNRQEGDTGQLSDGTRVVVSNGRLVAADSQ